MKLCLGLFTGMGFGVVMVRGDLTDILFRRECHAFEIYHHLSRRTREEKPSHVAVSQLTFY